MPAPHLPARPDPCRPRVREPEGEAGQGTPSLPLHATHTPPPPAAQVRARAPEGQAGQGGVAPCRASIDAEAGRVCQACFDQVAGRVGAVVNIHNALCNTGLCNTGLCNTGLCNKGTTVYNVQTLAVPRAERRARRGSPARAPEARGACSSTSGVVDSVRRGWVGAGTMQPCIKLRTACALPPAHSVPPSSTRTPSFRTRASADGWGHRYYSVHRMQPTTHPPTRASPRSCTSAGGRPCHSRWNPRS